MDWIKMRTLRASAGRDMPGRNPHRYLRAPAQGAGKGKAVGFAIQAFQSQVGIIDTDVAGEGSVSGAGGGAGTCIHVIL